MSETPLEQFRALVLADPELEQALRGAADRKQFVALAADRAQQNGCALAAADIEGALNAAARDWMLRWLVR
jgi:Nif11 domain